MIQISSALQTLYQKGSIFQFNVKFQILDRNYKVLYDSSSEPNNPVIDGEVTVDKYRSSVRDFRLNLVNISGKYTWNPGNLIWLDKYIKLFKGIWVNGAWEWLPQGVFPCTNPYANSKPGVNEVLLQGSDKMASLGKCEDNITVNTGTDIGTAIKTVLSGIETMFIFDDTTQMQTVPYDMTWPMNTDYSQIVSDLSGILSWETFYDVNGYLRLRAPIDPTSTAPFMNLSASAADFNLWGGAERQCDDSDLANYIVVNGGSAQTGFVQYILQDNNSNSPTSVQNIGKRIYLHNNGNPDPVITTQQLAQYRAQYEYKKRLQIVEKQNFDMFLCPFMDFDDVYEISDPSNGTTGKYQVVSFTLPLTVNSQLQTGYMWQVRLFS